MPGRSRPIQEDTSEALWTAVLGLSTFLPLFVVATFFGEPRGGPGRAWLVRAGMSLFLWLLAWSVAVPRIRELGRRGRWLPPGLQQRPFLAAAGYVASIMLAATLTWTGIIFGVAWAMKSIGLIHR